MGQAVGKVARARAASRPSPGSSPLGVCQVSPHRRCGLQGEDGAVLGGGAGGGIEGGLEVEDGVEVAGVVVVGFLHEAGIDHREDDAAEIVRADDVPVGQDGFGEETVAADGVVAETPAELLAGDVAGGVAVGFGLGLSVDLVDSVVEAVADELESLKGIATAFQDDLFEGFAGGFVHRHGDSTLLWAVTHYRERMVCVDSSLFGGWKAVT